MWSINKYYRSLHNQTDNFRNNFVTNLFQLEWLSQLKLYQTLYPCHLQLDQSRLQWYKNPLQWYLGRLKIIVFRVRHLHIISSDCPNTIRVPITCGFKIKNTAYHTEAAEDFEVQPVPLFSWIVGSKMCKSAVNRPVPRNLLLGSLSI